MKTKKGLFVVLGVVAGAALLEVCKAKAYKRGVQDMADGMKTLLMVEQNERILNIIKGMKQESECNFTTGSNRLF